MPVIAALVDAIAGIDPGEGERLATRSPDLIGDEAELAAAWIGAGSEEVSAAQIKIARRYRGFGDLWMSLLGGSTPSTLMLTALPADKRETLRQRMQSRFAVASPAGREIGAEALVVRGRG